ncbi:MAG: aspartate carbamoyltransferase [Desulfobacterales bacterium]|nr:MAG: aspartate carbamoyltransferase [Desulfobacterales bacterium]
MPFTRKDILDIASLSAEDIRLILDTARRMKEISRRPVKKVPTLRGRTIVLFFYEPSTRTRTSFDIAAKRLSADSISVSGSSSSLVKGESLIDTARNLEAMNADIIIMRHSSSGAPHLVAPLLSASVINAGDGAHAHPSQALLDMMAVEEHKGRLGGLRLSIIGDIAHSRVARSNIAGFTRMGAEVTVCGPPPMMPAGIEALGARVETDMDEAVRDADVIMMLRIQKERQSDYLMATDREYARFYGLSSERLSLARPDAIVLHPGPVNQGVEMPPDVADGPRSVILDQVTDGVAIRMALLYLVTEGEDPHAIAD